MQDSSPVFISIINFLHGGKGHVLEYHLAVRRAAILNNWKHVAAYSANEIIDDMPHEWNKCLKGDFLEKVNIYQLLTKSIFFKSIKSMKNYGYSIYKFLKYNHSKTSILFMESFNSLQLISLLFVVLCFKRDGLHLWLMYRNKPEVYGRIESQLFKFCNFIFGLLFKDKFNIFTDSELLRASLSTFFRRPVSVMPIPHTSGTLLKTSVKNNNTTVCWWAGTPRLNKGWDIIRHIAGSNESVAPKLRLVAAREANLATQPGGVDILSVKDVLDRDDYVNQLLACDICLLPYDPGVYSESTSGIFVECVVAGKIPIVSAGTWMAYELEKFHLEELCADWQNPNIVEWLISIAQQKNLMPKLTFMQNAYKNYHNESSYAMSMKDSYNCSH